jgi:hypothetical protein
VLYLESLRAFSTILQVLVDSALSRAHCCAIKILILT